MVLIPLPEVEERALTGINRWFLAVFIEIGDSPTLPFNLFYNP